MAKFYILSVETQLMKSKELNCANYHPNEFWLAGGPSAPCVKLGPIELLQCDPMKCYNAMYCAMYNIHWNSMQCCTIQVNGN